ncbi:VOC family protein [Mobilicoccus caccae]|uniref:VOC family protein n=1 Tax=Mobilicoccus caccae TaxID=1859295 RepID=A0ABQ6ITT0_9MICO|nr:VOC family protein [Mobilicoccus caccae]GMA40132.1 VOC family protein [Mobilicoccus caccae]
MGSRLNPHMFFMTSAVDALDFYRGVFGGTVSITTFADRGIVDTPDTDKVMHGRLETPAGFTLTCSDTPAGLAHEPGRNVAIALDGDDADDLRRWFAGLASGGQVVVPLEVSAGEEYGQLVDRFGIVWLVTVTT